MPDSSPDPLVPRAVVQAPVMFEGSRCLLGFCRVPVRTGLPPGVMFLATGLVGLGVAGLVRRGDQQRR